MIGAGSIAQELIDILEAFNTQIKVWTFHPKKHKDVGGSDVELEADLNHLIETSDIVTIHIPLSNKTEKLINQRLLDEIGTDKSRILINTSRAEIVEKSVLENLGEDSVFKSAGVDVYPEGLTYKSCNRILLTPHIAGLTQESSRRMREELVSRVKSKNY